MCSLAVPFKFDTPSPDEKNLASRGLKKNFASKQVYSHFDMNPLCCMHVKFENDFLMPTFIR